MSDTVTQGGWRNDVRLFISHATSDKPTVRAVAVQLRALGYDVWLDEEEILLGERILSQIEESLERADYLILFLSNDAIDSAWVAEEWRVKFEEQLVERRVAVIPVVLGYETRSPLFLRGRLHFAGTKLEVLRGAAAAIDRNIRALRLRYRGKVSTSQPAYIGPTGLENIRKEFAQACSDAEAGHRSGAIVETLVAARFAAASAYDSGQPDLALAIYETLLYEALDTRSLWPDDVALIDYRAGVEARIQALLRARSNTNGIDDRRWTARMVFDQLLDLVQMGSLLRDLGEWLDRYQRDDPIVRWRVFEPIRYAVEIRPDQMEPLGEAALASLCEVAVERTRKALESIVSRNTGSVDLHLAAVLRMCRGVAAGASAMQVVEDTLFLDMLSFGGDPERMLNAALSFARKGRAGVAPVPLRAAEIFDEALTERGYPRDAPYWGLAEESGN